MLKSAYDYFYFLTWRFGLWKPPDRQYLETEILGHLAQDPNVQNILFAGVQDYCRKYESLLGDKNFFTIDPDPKVAKFGGHTHWIAHIQSLPLLKPPMFQAIILNGVLGFGIDTPEEIEKTVEVCCQFLAPGGFVILGFNPNRVASFEPFEMRLRRCDWSGTHGGAIEFRMPLSEMSHRYIFYKK